MASATRLDDRPMLARPRLRSAPTPVLSLPTREPFTGRNRRFLPRVARRFAVIYEGDMLDGIDLSFRGMMCRAKEVIWPGNRLELELLLPNCAEPIPVLGRVHEIVTYRGELAMRVIFEDVTPSGRRRIALWMAQTT